MIPILRRGFLLVCFVTLFTLAPVWLLAAQPAPSPPQIRNSGFSEKPSGKVQWIYDGDTLLVAGYGRIRLLGIDSPERKGSPRDDFFLRWGLTGTTLRRIHEKSRRFLIDQVKGSTVTLACEGNQRDRYGRLLAYVTLPDGRLLNRVMLEKGYAVVYRRFDFSLKKDFLKAEEAARRNKQGLWE